MCIIYFAFDCHPGHPLVLIANRDEFYERPSRPAGYWDDLPHIYGGRDLAGGGTWLGVTSDGRFAAVTNYRDPSAPTGSRSRGELVTDFLNSADSASGHLANVAANGDRYSGFNLIAGEISSDRGEMAYFSNREGKVRQLSPGIYGLSNHLLDTPWPKVAKGKNRFSALLKSGLVNNNSLFEILSDKALAADHDLPSTGVPYEVEKAISAIFIETPGYGTRCSSVLTFDNDFRWNFEERVFV